MELWGYIGTELDPPVLVKVINYIPKTATLVGEKIGIK
jgi:hypothetical protein